jgi:hypothetical protein
VLRASARCNDRRPAHIPGPALTPRTPGRATQPYRICNDPGPGFIPASRPGSPGLFPPGRPIGAIRAAVRFPERDIAATRSGRSRLAAPVRSGPDRLRAAGWPFAAQRETSSVRQAHRSASASGRTYRSPTRQCRRTAFVTRPPAPIRLRLPTGGIVKTCGRERSRQVEVGAAQPAFVS